MPEGHGVHVDVSLTEKVPGWQRSQALRPVYSWTDPGAQTWHAVVRSAAWKVPAAQLVHCGAPTSGE